MRSKIAVLHRHDYFSSLSQPSEGVGQICALFGNQESASNADGYSQSGMGFDNVELKTCLRGTITCRKKETTADQVPCVCSETGARLVNRCRSVPVAMAKTTTRCAIYWLRFTAVSKSWAWLPAIQTGTPATCALAIGIVSAHITAVDALRFPQIDLTDH